MRPTTPPLHPSPTLQPLPPPSPLHRLHPPTTVRRMVATRHTSRVPSSAPPCASIFAVIIDSSNCVYASKTIEKSRTVTTDEIASSYTSRACSNCACRMKKSAREHHKWPASSVKVRNPDRMIASTRSPLTCAGRQGNRLGAAHTKRLADREGTGERRCGEARNRNVELRRGGRLGWMGGLRKATRCPSMHLCRMLAHQFAQLHPQRMARLATGGDKILAVQQLC